MSDEIDDGGPAFPGGIAFKDVGGHARAVTSSECGEGGMTMRDWFAGQALTGLNANPGLIGRNADVVGYPTYTPAMAAEDAYDVADAMLKERKRKTKPQKGEVK